MSRGWQLTDHARADLLAVDVTAVVYAHMVVSKHRNCQGTGRCRPRRWCALAVWPSARRLEPMMRIACLLAEAEVPSCVADLEEQAEEIKVVYDQRMHNGRIRLRR